MGEPDRSRKRACSPILTSRNAASSDTRTEIELVKPLAFVVLRAGVDATPDRQAELDKFVRAQLADFKRPRWVSFVSELPKTATGKIQRFKLRQLAAEFDAVTPAAPEVHSAFITSCAPTMTKSARMAMSTTLVAQ